jgi:nitrite reductase (NADH) large subunit
MMESRDRVIIIGNGMGGARLAEHLARAPGPRRHEIVMFGDEPHGNYNRILLSSVLAGSHKPKDIFMNPLSWYAANGIALHAGVRVSAIDRESRSVTGSNGVVETYDHLVFATGSYPFVPPIEGIRANAPGAGNGAFKPGVHVFRTLDDSLTMLEAAKSARRAVVIGGGLLGLEAAWGLLGRGLEVHVVEMAPFPMAMQLDAAAGDVLRRTLEGMGIGMHTGTSVGEVLGDGRTEGVVLADGTEVEAEMVVVSAGIRPNVQLARDAGLEVRRGIVVGDDLVSVTDSRIHAIGECAEHRGTVYGLVAPTWDQAETLASRLGGATPSRTYEGSVTSTRLKVMGIDLLVLGEKEPGSPTDEVVTFSNPMAGVYKKLIVRDGVLVGGILLGDPVGGPRLLEAFHRRAELPGDRADLLFPPSITAGEPARVVDAPGSFQVCNCNGVSKTEILNAIRSGCATMTALSETTRAGTGCGSCKSQLKDLLEAEHGGPVTEDPSVHFYVPAVPMTKPELVRTIRERGLKSVSAVLDALSEGAADPESKAGLASLLKILWGEDCKDERDARFINDRVHANIQKDGTFSVVPRILGGVVTPGQLRAIADVAEKYHVPMVKITGGQRIDLLGVQRSQLPDMWRDLGMASGHAYTKAVRTVKTCVGEEFCRFGLGNSTRLGIDIEARFQGIETPHKVKMAVSACPRNCAEATTKDVGIVAIEGGRWEIYVGGAAGSTVRKGDLLSVVDTHEAVLRFTGRFLQYYRENAKYLERSYGFVGRVGIADLRRILVEDAEGLGERLDREIEAAVGAYADPWSEGKSPVHPLQFSPELEHSRAASSPAGASSGRAPN